MNQGVNKKNALYTLTSQFGMLRQQALHDEVDNAAAADGVLNALNEVRANTKRNINGSLNAAIRDIEILGLENPQIATLITTAKQLVNKLGKNMNSAEFGAVANNANVALANNANGLTYAGINGIQLSANAANGFGGVAGVAGADSKQASNIAWNNAQKMAELTLYNLQVQIAAEQLVQALGKTYPISQNDAVAMLGGMFPEDGNVVHTNLPNPEQRTNLTKRTQEIQKILENASKIQTNGTAIIPFITYLKSTNTRNTFNTVVNPNIFGNTVDNFTRNSVQNIAKAFCAAFEDKIKNFYDSNKRKELTSEIRNILQNVQPEALINEDVYKMVESLRAARNNSDVLSTFINNRDIINNLGLSDIANELEERFTPMAAQEGSPTPFFSFENEAIIDSLPPQMPIINRSEHTNKVVEDSTTFNTIGNQSKVASKTVQESTFNILRAKEEMLKAKMEDLEEKRNKETKLSAGQYLIAFFLPILGYLICKAYNNKKYDKKIQEETKNDVISIKGLYDKLKTNLHTNGEKTIEKIGSVFDINNTNIETEHQKAANDLSNTVDKLVNEGNGIFDPRAELANNNKLISILPGEHPATSAKTQKIMRNVDEKVRVEMRNAQAVYDLHKIHSNDISME